MGEGEGGGEGRGREEGGGRRDFRIEIVQSRKNKTNQRNTIRLKLLFS